VLLASGSAPSAFNFAMRLLVASIGSRDSSTAPPPECTGEGTRAEAVGVLLLLVTGSRVLLVTPEVYPP
jgi:hypothetical protein